MHRLRRTAICAAALVAGGLGWAGAQRAGGQPVAGQAQMQRGREIPLFRTQSNLVLVDVVVTKKHGVPVMGLPESEFQVFEDGKPQRITYFVEHKATDAARVAEAPENLPAGVYSNQPEYTVGSAADVILLDALNTPFSDQVQVRQKMLHYLRSIPKGTRVAVFTLTSRLQMVQGFNADPEVLEKALESRRGEARVSPLMSEQPNENAAIGMFLHTAPILPANSPLTFMQDMQVQMATGELGGRINLTIDAMDELARYLSAIPGRKNVIWFTGAFPGIPIGGSDQRWTQSDYSDEVKRMNALLALARVSLYPVDARGLRGSKNQTAEAQITNPNLMNSAPGEGTVTSSEMMSNVIESGNRAFMSENFQEHGLMKQVAEATGGKAYVNTNAVGEAMADAVANGAYYYTVGYVPENRNYNGAYRSIRVKVEAGHYQLQFRRGYYALSAQAMKRVLPGRVNPLIAAMQPGAPELSQVRFRAQATAAGAEMKKVSATAGSGGKMAAQLKNPQRYMVDYWIDPKTLEMTKLADERTQAKVELTEVVFNRMGIRENYQDTALELDLTPADVAKAMKDGVHLQQVVDVPRGESILRLGVRDIGSGRIGTVEIPVKSAK